DSNRPRNAATLASHGYLSRDGVSPLKLRKLGLIELDEYDGVTYLRGLVERIAHSAGQTDAAFTVTGTNLETTATNVVLATGLREQLPTLPSMRAFYGTSLHSCLVCDGYEKRDRPL